MTKTPDEIKKGLECCAMSSYRCEDDCPYREQCRYEQGGKAMNEDAIALIQQLEAQVHRWISVEERLPEMHGQRCVGLYNQHGADKSLLFSHVFTWHAYGDNGYVNGPHFSDEGLDGLKVHYWMPLPEPPKESP